MNIKKLSFQTILYGITRFISAIKDVVIYTFYTTSTIYGTFISDYTIITTLPNIIYSTLHPVFIRECSERSSKEVFYPAVRLLSFIALISTGFLLV